MYFASEALKALKTYCLRQILTMNDGLWHEYKIYPQVGTVLFFPHEIFLHWCINVTYSCALIKEHNNHENQCNIWNKVFRRFNAAHTNYDNCVSCGFFLKKYNTKRLTVKYAKLVITLKVDLLVFPHGYFMLFL